MTSVPWLQTLRSPDALAALSRERAPQIAAVVLAVALGAEIARLLTGFAGAGALAPVDAAAAGYRPPAAGNANRNVDLAALANAHLFGQVAVNNTGAAAPPTTLALILAGVLAADDPSKGFAIVGETAAAAKLHAVGSDLPGGVKLHAVYGDRVLIDRGGTLETLSMPRQSPAGMQAPLPAAPPSSPTANVEAMRALVAQNPGVLSTVLRTQQVMAGGKQRGFRVYPGSNPGAFNRLGLRAGDLITAVNGTPLDDPARGEEIMHTLGSSAEVRVTVMRNGRQSDMVLDIAQVANEAQQIVPTEGMTPASQAPPMPAPGSPD